MKLKDQVGWDKCVAANSDDDYGKAGVDYAKAWAELMEQYMADGTVLSDIAEQASHDADTEGITGFMYGCAVSILSQVWEHGEELRRWHNLKTQIKDEGEKANETDGVLNPAIVTLK